MNNLELHFEIAELVEKFLDGRLNEDEFRRLKKWIGMSEKNKQLWMKLTDLPLIQEQLSFWEDRKSTYVQWRRLRKRINCSEGKKGKVSIMKTSLKYVAVLIGVILLGSLFWTQHRNSGNHSGGVTLDGSEIVPKGKIAQLVLSDGASINLREVVGQVFTEGDGTLVRNQENMLSYTATKSQQNEQLYNTLSVPRGGEYLVVLSDGTKVWLNAASSLKYPTRFGKNERRVILSGEAYFEVAKDLNRPFWVESGMGNVKVLGTKFNVSAYFDDPKERISLAEGSVLVERTKGEKVLLKPGYSAILEQENKSILVDKANIEAALSWKNAMFVFEDEQLGSIMMKLSRWYNVEIEYEDGVDTLFHFSGSVKRYEKISGILQLIEMTKKVKFELHGREVKVKLY